MPALKTILRVVVVVLAAWSVSCSPREATTSGTVRLRAVVMPYLTHMPFHIAAAEGYFAEEGLDVEFLPLRRSQDIMASLAHGEVDVTAGMLSINELSLAAAGARVRVVAGLASLAPDACTTMAFLARRDVAASGALTDPQRLRDLRIDVDLMLPFGYFLDELIAPMGVTTRDLNLVDVPPPAAIESLRQGAIDVTGEAEPFLTHHAAAGASVVWRGVESILPGYVQSVLMYGPNLLDERPEVGHRFMRAMLKAARQFRRGKTARNLEIVAEASGLGTEVARMVCWPQPLADGRVSPASFAAYQRWAVDHGLLDRVLGAADLFDDRFVEEANAEIAR